MVMSIFKIRTYFSLTKMDYVLSVHVFESVVKKNVLMLIEDVNDVQTLTNIDGTTGSSCAAPIFRNVNLMMQTQTSTAHEIINDDDGVRHVKEQRKEVGNIQSLNLLHQMLESTGHSVKEEYFSYDRVPH